MLANFSLFSLAEFSFSLDKTFLLLTVGLVLSVEESESLKKVSLSSKRILGSSEEDSDSISEGSVEGGLGWIFVFDRNYNFHNKKTCKSIYLKSSL